MIENYRNAILDSIRESSRIGQLLPEKEIRDNLIGMSKETDCRIGDADAQAICDEIIRSHEDIHVISDRKGCRYYFSALTMTEGYARLLVLMNESTLDVIASIAREHSEKYSRPVPISVFQHSPFELSGDEIAICTHKMIELKDYDDMDQVTTSIGTRFLYSKRYLDADHALMLAEWEDVGQCANP